MRDELQLVGDDPQKTKKASAKTQGSLQLPALPRPFTAFGSLEEQQAESFVVRGATVWTNEDEGIVESADVYVVNGKIMGFGESLKVPAGVKEIDGRGKHLTSGIIDEHSHIAISRGVNESSQESTAEVRIGDVINSEDVNIYRHLAGGVTAVQLLHGSANPIGGQSALIKLRWGAAPEDLKIAGADGYIKFALGENVKQSNWSGNTTRYPQTRMGVEQVYEDYFTRAAAYARARKADPKGVRRDLDLEALAEILNRERFITCHSYRQSEINMLMKVAERHGFVVNTFTHILEGYKVADKMREHGVGASTFSDWWAYKFEVWDAIPENGPIMHEQGVTVAYNSDDAELGRRLNQEAAKAVQYGGISEEEAWKFVTLNPAKLLHLDQQTGSIKTGKDADLVLWNEHPMSVYALAEKTWVDGIMYFDREQMRERQMEMAAERNRLAQAMLNDKHAGKRTQPVEGHGGEHWHCDSE
jgi:imidazolonepropionase-like amidohydrolase